MDSFSFEVRDGDYNVPADISITKWVEFPLAYVSQGLNGYKWETAEKVEIKIFPEDIRLYSIPHSYGRTLCGLVQRIMEHHNGMPVYWKFSYEKKEGFGEFDFSMELELPRDFELQLQSLASSGYKCVCIGEFGVTQFNKIYYSSNYSSRKSDDVKEAFFVDHDFWQFDKTKGFVNTAGHIKIQFNMASIRDLLRSNYFLHRHLMTRVTPPGHYSNKSVVTVIPGLDFDNSGLDFIREALSHHSQVFSAMFEERWCGESPPDTIKLPVSSDGLQVLSIFFFDGSIPTPIEYFNEHHSLDLTIEMLNFAHEYMIHDLERRLTDFVYLLIVQDKLTCANDIVRLFVFYTLTGVSGLVLDKLKCILKRYSQQVLVCDVYEEMCWRAPENADLVADYLNVRAFMITNYGTKLAVF